MQHILFSQAIFACFVVALYFSIHFFSTNEMKYIDNRLFMLFCLSSAIWSLGFYGIIIQTVPDHAYPWRVLGMIGVFGYLITAQILVCRLAELKRIPRILSEGFSFLGISVYFIIIQKDQVSYQLSDIGTTYTFRSGLGNNIYTAYCILSAVNLLCVICYMLFCSKLKRGKELGKKLLVTEIIIILGMLFDTIFPLLGKTAVPGSTLGQFFGLVVMYNAITFVNHSRININNMSEFIYDSLSTPVLVYDSKKELQILNDTASSSLEIKKNEYNSMSIDRIFDLTESEAFDFEQKHRDVDAVCHHNQLYCTLSINKIYDNYGDILGYIIIVTDLSERMKYVKQLEDAKKEAEYATQAKSTFLANMSHEIRTPMNAIIGFSELLLKMDISEEVRSHVQDIKLSSNNLLAIINDILDISKIESGKMEIIPGNYFVATLFRDVSLIIQAQAKQKGLSFHMKIDEHIPKELFGDKVRIRGVLMNILNNAVKYTDEGSVLFEVSIQSRTDSQVTLEFKVTDTGIGIRKEDQEGIFKKFERLDQKLHYGVEGSGLGLAIANGYVTLMGGEIQLSSEYGKGSVFTVILTQDIIDDSPITEDYYIEEKQGEVDSADSLKVHGVRVLAVDDNPVNLRVAKGILSSYGLVVDTASGGKEAIELCNTTQYPLIFMDQMMPEMDGIQAMQQIRTLSPYYSAQGAGKIIVLTADAISGAKDKLISLGFDEYLGKPMNTRQLERLLIQFLPEEVLSFQEKNTASAQKNDPDSDKESAELSYLKTCLKGVDLESGIKNCGGSIEDYLSILKITYDHGEKMLSELQTLQQQQEYQNYTIKIHSAKSTTLNIGALALSELAKNQESAGRNKDYGYIDDHVDLFQNEYRILLSQIQSVLEHYHLLDTGSEEPAVQETLGEDMIHRILKSILQDIDAFDFDHIFTLLEEVKKYQIPEAYQDTFRQIEAWMDDLSVEQIQSLIREQPGL
ncbi:MAG: ATP-binding protein [Clostridiales bacterium]|nr:ATP-binding protein [Clostridiales bacterium]